MIWPVLVLLSLMCLQVDNTDALVNELLRCKQKFLGNLTNLGQLTQCFNSSVTTHLPTLLDIPPECTNLTSVEQCVTSLIANLNKINPSEILGDLTAVFNALRECLSKGIAGIGNLNDYIARGCPDA